MGKRLKAKIHSMNLTAKITVVVCLTVMLSVFLYGGWYQPQRISADTTGATSAASATGSTWTSPTSALAQDGTYASFNSTSQGILSLSGFNFAIPSGATIRGVTATVWGYGAGTTPARRTVRINLTTDGTNPTTGVWKTQALGASNASYAVGGSTDTWGATLTPANVNTANFGVLISDNDTTAHGLYMDYVSLEITYSFDPTVTSLSPGSMAQGTSNTVTVAGTNFQPAATVTFSGTGVSAGASNFISSSSLTVLVTVDSAAATGLRDVTVTNPDGGTYTKPGAFSVDSAASCTANTPTLAVSPPSTQIAAGADMIYTVAVTNNDAGPGCGNVTYTLGLTNSNTTDFTITSLPSTITVGPGSQGTATFTVTAKATAADGAMNTSTVSATANLHPAPPNATAVTTVNSSNTPLMHNSANLDPTNQKGYGTWGETFTCTTCHTRNSANVKRVQENIETPTGSKPVFFTRISSTVTDAQGTFGDDLRSTYANASRNVCEVCHHKTLYHQYSSTKIANRSTDPHYNRKDCASSCHPHSAGFRGAGCDSCHGNPPTTPATLVFTPEATQALGTSPTNAGAHDAHVNSEGMKCSTCHSGNTMPTVSKTIQMGFEVNNTNWPAFAGTVTFGSMTGHSPLGGNPAYTWAAKTGTKVGTASTYRTSCNVYCHGQWTGSGRSMNPSWIITDGSQSACGTCHAATAANPPSTGKHLTHAGSSSGNYGFSCTKCHPNGSGFSHVNGSVQWRLSSATNGLIGSTATYTPNGGSAAIGGQTNAIAPSAVYGTCNNIYCHSTAQGSNGTSTGITYTAPKWSDAALGCGGCHADMSGASGTGDHVKHANTNNIACANCHGNGYSSTGVTTATHVNRNIDLKFSNGTIAPLTSYQKGTSFPAGTAAYSYCSNSYCHSSGQSDGAKAAIYRQPVWGTTVTNCGSCHNNMKTFANATSGSHVIHAQATGANYDCAVCHNGYTASTVTSTTHVDRKINLGFTGNGTGTAYSKYSAAGFAPGKGSYGTCGNNKCHGGAAVKIAWGGDTSRPTCFKCHGSTATTGFVSVTSASVAPGGGTAGRDLAGNISASAARLGAHQPHMTAASGVSDTVHCTACHVRVNSFTDAAHLNYTTATVTLSGLATANSHSPVVTRVSGLIQCSNTYCHTALRPSGAGAGQGGLNNTPNWNNTAFLGNTSIADTCTNKCHAMPPGAGVNGDTHGALAAVGSALSGTVLATCSSQTGGTGCHPTINVGGASISGLFNDRLLHINGQVEGGTCVGCHNTAVGGSPSPAGSRRRVTASAAGNGEFTVASATAYTNMTSHIKTTAVSTLSCQFCHEQSSHKTYADGISVKLQNTWAAGTIVYNGTSSSLTYFCTGCHRSAGYGGTIPSGALGTATQPYKDSGSNSTPDNIFADWSSAGQYSGTSDTTTFKPAGVRRSHRKAAQCMDCHGDTRTDSTTTPKINAHASTSGKYLRFTGASESATCFSSASCHGSGATGAGNVYSEFKVNNASAGTGGAHPILAAVTPKSSRISGDTAGATFVNGWKSNSIATCSDCHGSAAKNGPKGPHGSSQPYLLKALQSSVAGGSVAYPTTHTNGTALSTTGLTLTNAAAFCINCHAADIYGDGNGARGSAAGTRFGHGSVASNKSACLNISTNLMGNSCQSCHCGKGYNDGSQTALELGTHSTTAPVATGVSNVGFVNGNNWTKAPDTTTGCYATEKTSPAYVSGWGTCGQGPHQGSDSRFKKNIGAILDPLKKLFSTDLSRYRHDGNIPVLIDTVREQQQMIEGQQQEIEEIRSTIRKMNR